MAFQPFSAGASTNLQNTISQTAHGFVVGDWVYHNGTAWAKADADLSYNASQAVGVIAAGGVVDANTFKVTFDGLIDLTGATYAPLTAGSNYYLSTTAGAATATAISGIFKALFTATSTTGGYIVQGQGQTAVVDYIHASQSTTTATTTGNAIPFDTIQSGNIPLNTGTGLFTLTGGKTYKLSFSGQESAGATIQWQTAAGTPLSTALISNSTANSVASYDVVYTPLVNTDVKATTTAGSVAPAGAHRFSVVITQIGASPVPMSLAGEYGSVSVNAQTFSTNSFVDSTNGIYNIPSAGTWMLRYNIASDGTGANANSQFAITDSSNTIISGSERTRGGSVTTAQFLGAEVIVTTVGATTYKIRGRNGGSGSAAILNATNNDSTITWQKISGFIPSSGQTVDYVYATNSGTSAPGTTAAIPFTSVSGNIPNSSGDFTLTAGKTYRLQGSLRTNQANAGITFNWYNVTASSDIGTTAFAAAGSGDGTTTSTQGIAEYTFTPSVNTVVRLRSQNAVTISANGGWINIQQLGSSAVIAGVYPGTWTSYTPSITGGTTNPTLATTHIKRASYMVQGKTMFIRWNYSSASNAGATAGSGSYRFPIPGGYAIDTAIAVPPTVTGTGANAGFDGVALGFGHSNNGTESMSGVVVAIDSTSLALYGSNFGNTFRGLVSSVFQNLDEGSNNSLSFTAQVPIV